eukprot:s31_g4.t1
MGEAVLGTLFPCGVRVKVIGSVQVPPGCTSFAIFKALMVESEPMICFLAEDPDAVMYHGRCTKDDFTKVIELCSGMGIGSLGLSPAGMETVCAVDWSQPLITAFEEMNPGIPTVCGDIASDDTIRQVYRLHPHPAALFSGFSCQPYSTGGSQRGADDQRSSTLYSTLRFAYMLRCVCIILECVKDAATNSMVRRQIESFRDQCKFHLTEQVLELESVWVSRRTRWWAVLSAPFVGPVQLRPFPLLHSPSVPRDLLPLPMSLTSEDLQQLELRGHELDTFLRFVPRLASLFLSLDGKAPTALHSWGNQTVPCQCGCRSAGFSEQTLQSRGIFALLFPVSGPPSETHPEVPRVRHPHPLEVGLLTGVPELVWPSNRRLCLAGLGQQASPLQVVWVCAHLQRQIDLVYNGVSAIDPLECLQDVRNRVMSLAEHVEFDPISPADMPEPPVEVSLDSPLDDLSMHPWVNFRHLGQPDECTVVHYLDPVPFVTKLQDPEFDTVAAVIQATSDLLQVSDAECRVVDCSSGLNVSFAHPAAGLCLWVCRTAVTLVPAFDEDALSPTLEWAAEAPEPAAEPVAEMPIPPAVECARPSSPPPLEPLVSLDASRLLLVPEPSVPDLSLVKALRRQTIDSSVRKQILANQGPLWSDDELCWHVEQLMSVARKPNWVFLDPLLAAEAVKRPSSHLLSQWLRSVDTKPSAILGLVPIEGHWTPCMWTWTPKAMIVSIWDVEGTPAAGMAVLHQALATAVGARTFTTHIVHRRFAVGEYCGLCGLRFIDNMLRGKMLPSNLDEVKQLHAAARSKYVDFLESCSTVGRPWIWCAGLDAKATERLHALLIEHGVEAAQVKHRATLLIQAIGLPETQRSLTSGQPWRALKAAANKCRPVFQLVLPQELEEVVQQKAAQGGLKGKRKKASSTKPAPKPVAPSALDPAKLSLEDGSFTVADGAELGQINMQDIGPFSRGVVLTTMEESAAYLKAGQLVSNSALALVLINSVESQLVTSLSWTSLRVVLRCQANGEPMLAPAFLIQLGKTPVAPKANAGPHDVLHAPAVCFKVTMYRDETEDWASTIQSPVKYVLGRLMPLQVCQSGSAQSPCTCAKWHPGVDDVVSDPVLDIWRRQWLTLNFRPAAPADAEVFLFNMRCLATLQTSVLAQSGRHGIYLEPRSLDSRDPLMDFQVLWMPKTPRDELDRLQQCTPQILGLARLGARLGIRSTVADAPDLARKLKPGSIFLAAGTKMSFEVGPLPFGMDRLTVSRLCSQLENKLMARLPASDMEVDSSGQHEARFAALEQQVQSLTMNQQSLEGKIHEAATKTEAQFANIQAQVGRQLDAQGNHIQSMFATQMAQIEALLSKKHRAE